MNLSPNRGLRFCLLPPSTSLRSPITYFVQSCTIKHLSLILNAPYSNLGSICHIEANEAYVMLNYEKNLSLWLTVSTSKFSSSLMLKRLSSSRKIPLHRPRSSSQYLQIPKSFSSSDISYIHSWNINWKSIKDNYQDTQHTNPGHSIFPTYSGTSHAKIHEKIRHDLC